MLLSQQILSTETLPAPSILAPAPWTLTGNGYIFLYRLPKKLIQENGFLADYQNVFYKGLVSSIMLVDYHTTPVGPYRELLFIPGLFKMVDKYTFSISKIYVSDQNSVWNGIENWGIPKEWADFDVQKLDERAEKITISIEDKPFFEATIRRGTISFPLTTALFPFRITQQLRKDWVLTKPEASGKAYFGKLTDVKVNSELFPDITPFNPVAVLVIKDFQMKFPEAEFRKIEL
jgi:hypothetical protein